MTTAFLTPTSFGLRGGFGVRTRCGLTVARSATSAAGRWRMTESQEQPSTSTKSDGQSGSSSSTPGPDLGLSGFDQSVDTEAYVERLKTIASDLTQRPFYYSTIFGYVVGGVVVLTVLRAIVSAIDSLPVLPGALELIGLGYTAWFIWRYVLFRESRTELLEEIEDFFGRTRAESDDQ